MGLPNRAVNVPNVVVAIPANLRRRLDLYVTQCKYEISGLGTVELNEDSDLEVTELYLLDQLVSSGDTELPSESVAKFMAEAPDKGIDLSKVRLWWHSHANMSVYWSPTDEVAINSFDAAPWFVSVVGNHAGDYLARIDLFPTELTPVRIRQPAILETIHPNEEVDKVRSEIADRVSVSEPSVPDFTGLLDEADLSEAGLNGELELHSLGASADPSE